MAWIPRVVDAGRAGQWPYAIAWRICDGVAGAIKMPADQSQLEWLPITVAQIAVGSPIPDRAPKCRRLMHPPDWNSLPQELAKLPLASGGDAMQLDIALSLPIRKAQWVIAAWPARRTKLPTMIHDLRFWAPFATMDLPERLR